ncbi:uncharacterized protein LOC128232025 [Mya arenaria]|nr:uncharacterized protein LOC128232025 [Mya arenaria]XP_052801324.1 uncharacterized protein LOC128232025 [Mya arenaria]XP_052801325.1 uncharacterized protein LOC128232025 [Mya arenaria]
MLRTCYRPLPLDLLALPGAVTAFLMHVVGTATPYWWVVHEEDVTHVELIFYYGIWEIVDCENNTCVKTPSKMHGDRAWLIGPAVLLVMAGALLLLSLVASIVLLWRRSVAHNLRKIAVIFSGGAGTVIIMAVLIFYKKKAGLRPSDAPETSDGDPDWALFLSTGSALVAIANSVLIGYAAKRYSKKNLDKFSTIFGLWAADLEIDVNALREGELRQGRKVNITSLNDGSLEDMYKRPRVNVVPSPRSPVSPAPRGDGYF